MLKYTFTAILTLFVLFAFPQSIVGEKVTTYSFDDSTEKMVSKLSPEAKSFLEMFLLKNNIDTTNVYRVKYDEIFTKFTSPSYLSNHTYTYVRWSKTNDSYNIREVSKMNGHVPILPNKLIILYSTNFSEFEDLMIYFMN